MGVINHGLHWFETQSTRITDERSYEKLGFKSYLFILGGVVVDSFIKNPVDSCIVTIATAVAIYGSMRATAMTDSGGIFVIDSVLPGAYSVTVERKDYFTFTGRLMMEHRDMLDYRIPLLRISDAPNLVVSTSSFDITVRVGGGVHRTVIISNAGDGISLIWGLSESPPVGWLDENPTKGVVSPHQGQTVDLHFYASSSMAPGVYKTNLITESNDPYRPIMSIPVEFKVMKVEHPF